jgi:DNA-binding transcriptional regulator YiaG
MKDKVTVNPLTEKTLAMSLKELRKDKLKMSQERFADVIGVRRHSVSRWETGFTTPMLTFDQFRALLKEMNRAGLDLIKDLPEGLTQAETEN